MAPVRVVSEDLWMRGAFPNRSAASLLGSAVRQGETVSEMAMKGGDSFPGDFWMVKKCEGPEMN